MNAVDVYKEFVRKLHPELGYNRKTKSITDKHWATGLAENNLRAIEQFIERGATPEMLVDLIDRAADEKWNADIRVWSFLREYTTRLNLMCLVTDKETHAELFHILKPATNKKPADTRRKTIYTLGDLAGFIARRTGYIVRGAEQLYLLGVVAEYGLELTLRTIDLAARMDIGVIKLFDIFKPDIIHEAKLESVGVVHGPD